VARLQCYCILQLPSERETSSTRDAHPGKCPTGNFFYFLAVLSCFKIIFFETLINCIGGNRLFVYMFYYFCSDVMLVWRKGTNNGTVSVLQYCVPL